MSPDNLNVNSYVTVIKALQVFHLADDLFYSIALYHSF